MNSLKSYKKEKLKRLYYERHKEIDEIINKFIETIYTEEVTIGRLFKIGLKNPIAFSYNNGTKGDFNIVFNTRRRKMYFYYSEFGENHIKAKTKFSEKGLWKIYDKNKEIFFKILALIVEYIKETNNEYNIYNEGFESKFVYLRGRI